MHMNEKPAGVSARYKTQEDYMLTERQGTTKNEFRNGNIMPLSGSNRWHNMIVSNLTIAIGSRIHGPKFDIYVSNMKVQLRNNIICYPDVVVVNGDPAFADNAFDLLLNPTLVAEVVSKTTSSADKTQKLENFLAMDSIRECLFVKEDEMRVEHYAKQNAKQWIYRIYNERDDVVSMDSINCKVSLQEIYAQIKVIPAHMSSAAIN